MNKSVEIYKLPSPVLAVTRHDDGTVSYSFSPALYQAQSEAERNGAREITLKPWQSLNLPPHSPAS